MARILRVSFLIFLAAAALASPAFATDSKAKKIPSYALPVTPSFKRLADQTNDFYAWYLSELNAGVYPMESARAELEKYVTVRLLKEIAAMPLGPDGLDGDYFVNAQEWDPSWEGNTRVAKVSFDQGVVRQDVILTGPKSAERRLAVFLVQEGSAWKIDRVEPGSK